MNKKINRNKVLFIRTDPGVIDSRIQKEAGSLVKLGYEVLVFGWDRKSQFPKKETLNGIHFHRTRIPASYGSKLLAFLLPFFWIRAIYEITVYQPHIIHACDLDAFIPALIFKSFTKRAVVYDIFDHFAEKMVNIPDILRRFIRRIDRALMVYADVLIVTDDHRKSLLSDVPIKNLSVVMNVPIKQNFDTRKENDILRICQVGAIHEHRGLKLIADAVRNLENVETLFAGWIPRKIDEDYLNSQKSIKYLGKLSYKDALDLVASCDVVLALYDPSLPINAMASSNKVFEAMATHQPVITNIETSMAKIVQEEHCGILIPYGDVDALRHAIIKLKNDNGLRYQFGNNGHRAFETKYNWSIMESRLKSIYSTLIKKV